MLDRSYKGPIHWITGPPGAGKTTLVASWLGVRQLPCLWYSLDDGDSDPASLFYFLGMAAQKAAPRKRRPLPLLTPEYLQGIPAFSRLFFENLFRRLGRRTAGGHSQRGEFAVIFDNYQEVPEASWFHEILYEGLLLVPPGIRMILVSRKDPPEIFARFRANTLMTTIGSDDLKFTFNESNKMVRLRGYKKASLVALEQLHEKTSGWAAGIVLVLEGAKKEGIESVLSKNRTPKEIFEYFAREIFDRAEPETREFLLKTSFFPRVSVKMAEALTGHHQATRKLLLELNGRNFFTQRLQSDAPLFEYHPLFREFLQFVAGQVFSPGDISDLQKKAAAILEENGQVEDAVQLLRKAEDWSESVKLILKHAKSLIGQGRGKTLDNWIKGLPEAVLQTEPWLLYWAGVCRLPYSPPDSRVFFDRALNLFMAGRQDLVEIFLSLSGLFDSIFYSLGAFQPYDEAIDLLYKVLDEFPSFPSFEIEVRLTISKLYALVFRQPWHPDLEETVERAVSLLPAIADVNSKMQLLHCLASYYLFAGEMHKAGPLIDIYRGLVRTPDAHPLFQTALKVAESLCYLSMAEIQKGRRAAEEGLEISSRTGIHVVDAYLLGYSAIAAINSGDMEAADTSIERMAACLDEKHYWGQQFRHLLRAWKFLIEGDSLNALSHAEMSLRFGIDAGVPQTVSYGYFFYALVLHELKRGEEANNHLAEGCAIARRAGATIVEFACLLAKAKFSFDRGNDSSGLILLKKAMAIGRAKGYLSALFIWMPGMMAELCRRALEAGIEEDYVSHLIIKRNLMPGNPPSDCEKWPWALKVYTLGRLEIVRDGELLECIQSSGKIPKKPLEMLKALIASGGEVSEKQIVDLFWPDSYGDVAHSAFTTTLSRLRRLLGVERAIRCREGMVSLDPRYCWLDAAAFENIVAQLDREFAATPARTAEGVLKLVEKASRLYRGHFLPADADQVWTFSYRERLRSRFGRVINTAGNLLEKMGQWEKAAEYYKKGIEIDDLSEEFYQRLMVCHRKLGQHANAIEVYKRCRWLLSTKIGIEPSTRTKAIYDGLKKEA
jgi:DNA-binding SARP family transcriptional activator